MCLAVNSTRNCSKYACSRKARKALHTHARPWGANCPLCAMGTRGNRTRIYSIKEMDADHMTAWSNGGTTSADNCQMLCKTHNRAKGNK